MSRVVILGTDNISAGEFTAFPCNLGFSLGGNPTVSPGSNNSIKLNKDAYLQKWLDFGAGVVIQPADLPIYMGMIDTPWAATKPAGMTLYDAEYFFALRTIEAPTSITGTIDTIMNSMINMLNDKEDLFVRMGNIGGDIDRSYMTQPLDTRSIWDQFQAFALKTGTEFVLRPKKEADNRWYLYVDIGKTLGQDTGFLLSDGPMGNMRVTNATVTGQIYNRITGINSASTPQSRLATDPQEDAVSQKRYRMRNVTTQFRDVNDKSTLLINTINALSASSVPYLRMDVEVQNINHAFLNLRLGNTVLAHASSLVLPRGVQGWRGKCRIVKMVYKEATDSVAMTLYGALYA